MAEGDLVVQRALSAGCVPVVALVDGSRPPALVEVLEPSIDVFAGSEALRTFVTQLGVAHSIVAIFRRPPRPQPLDLAARARRLVLVEAVDNPANIGSIVRNAAGLGWDGLILDTSSGDPLARRALPRLDGACAQAAARTHDGHVRAGAVPPGGRVPRLRAHAGHGGRRPRGRPCR